MNVPFFSMVPLSLLNTSDYNARRFEQNSSSQRLAKFDELVASVREKGVLEPLLVRELADNRFEIVAGERRFRAAWRVAEESGSDQAVVTVPCMVHDLDDDAAFDLMLVENLQREDLTAFESAQAFRVYLDRHGNTAEAINELSARTGIPGHAIRRQLRLLSLPAEILEALQAGQISQSHAELFTRLDDAAQALELLAACQRNKLTVRELAERIGSVSPDLDKGFFDKGGCQICQFNTSVQSGLFAEVAPAGKCGSPACFEEKQAAFLTANWSQSKAAARFGTNGFRFGHRLNEEHREPLNSADTAQRCLGCDAFVSVLRLTGVVVSGYDRTCVGPVACFEELYLAKPETGETEPAISETETAEGETSAAADDCGHSRPVCPGDGSTCPDCLDPGPPTAQEGEDVGNRLGKALADARKAKGAKSAPTAEESGPVFDAVRGERARKVFFREALKATVRSTPEHQTACQRLVLTVLALSSSAVKRHLAAGLGWPSNVKPDQMAKSLFEIPAEDLGAEAVAAAVAHVIDDDFTFSAPAVLPFIAEKFDVTVNDWQMDERYLGQMNKSELVRIGEEPDVALWTAPEVESYRKANHKGKALRALGKQELIDCVLKSGVDLHGRIPAEVIGRPVKK